MPNATSLVTSGSINDLLLQCKATKFKCRSLSHDIPGALQRALAAYECAAISSAIKCLQVMLVQSDCPNDEFISPRELAHDLPWEWVLNTTLVACTVTLSKLGEYLAGLERNDDAEYQIIFVHLVANLSILGSFLRSCTELLNPTIDRMHQSFRFEAFSPIARDSTMYLLSKGITDDPPSFVCKVQPADFLEGGFPYRFNDKAANPNDEAGSGIAPPSEGAEGGVGMQEESTDLPNQPNYLDTKGRFSPSGSSSAMHPPPSTKTTTSSKSHSKFIHSLTSPFSKKHSDSPKPHAAAGIAADQVEQQEPNSEETAYTLAGASAALNKLPTSPRIIRVKTFDSEDTRVIERLGPGDWIFEKILTPMASTTSSLVSRWR